MEMSRRAVLGSLVAGAAGSTLLSVAGAAEQKGIAVPALRNEDFYGADGKFDAEKAKQAYYDMMKRFNYPVYERLRTADFWALDFGLGKFTEVGMAGIFWVNNQKDGYFGHEIYLLPGQMIPEHRHVKTEEAGPKLEAWQPRYGWIYIYGEGAPTPGVEAHIPASHQECAVARTEQKLMPGEVGMLGGAEQWHWMLAGPEGAIVTEYATYHDGTGLRFSHPQVAF
jgi:D-lyxose ketol-isomerase